MFSAALASITSRRIAIMSAALATIPAAVAVAHAEGEGEKKIAFSPKEFRAFPVRKIQSISSNTKVIELALPTPEHEMGMEVASFILIKGPNDAEGKIVTRPYTPTSTNAEKGVCELVVKAYPGGHLTTYLHNLHEGDLVEVKGPLMKLKYEPNKYKQVGMLAGGTGLTPNLQVLKEILRNPEDRTQVHLVFANNSEEDILLKDVLDEIARTHSDRVKVTYVVSSPRGDWQGHRGYINAEIIQQTMPAPGEGTMIFVCGPLPFMEAISGKKTPDFKQGEVSGLLKAAGYNESMVFKF